MSWFDDVDWKKVALTIGGVGLAAGAAIAAGSLASSGSGESVVGSLFEGAVENFKEVADKFDPDDYNPLDDADAIFDGISWVRPGGVFDEFL